MKYKYPLYLTGLRFQVDHISPKKIQLFEEFNTDPLIVNARLSVILFRHRKIEMIPDGNEIIGVRVL